MCVCESLNFNVTIWMCIYACVYFSVNELKWEWRVQHILAVHFPCGLIWSELYSLFLLLKHDALSRSKKNIFFFIRAHVFGHDSVSKVFFFELYPVEKLAKSFSIMHDVKSDRASVFHWIFRAYVTICNNQKLEFFIYTEENVEALRIESRESNSNHTKPPTAWPISGQTKYT